MNILKVAGITAVTLGLGALAVCTGIKYAEPILETLGIESSTTTETTTNYEQLYNDLLAEVEEDAFDVPDGVELYTDYLWTIDNDSNIATINGYVGTDTEITIPGYVGEIYEQQVSVTYDDTWYLMDIMYELEPGDNISIIVNDDGSADVTMIVQCPSVGDEYNVAIGVDSFRGDHIDVALTSVVMLDGVVSVDVCAFGNQYITNLVLADTITYIGSSAFSSNYGCIATVILPSSLTTFSSSVFNYSSLETIYVYSEDVYDIVIAGIESNGYSSLDDYDTVIEIIAA